MVRYLSQVLSNPIPEWLVLYFVYSLNGASFVMHVEDLVLGLCYDAFRISFYSCDFERYYV